MKKVFGITGYNGKIGSILASRPNFVILDCDITKIDSIKSALNKNTEVGVIVNCAAKSSVEFCETNYQKAIDVNVNGLAKLHKVFGSKVLNISSDHVFSGNYSLRVPAENKLPSPIGNYGFTKLGAEAVSKVYEGKTLRISRSVSVRDPDIQEWLQLAMTENPLEVPNVLFRSYVHREYVANAIEYMVNNWDKIPNQLVNYGGLDTISMFTLIQSLMFQLGFSTSKLSAREEYLSNYAPRPKNGGLNIALAKRLGFPMYSIDDTIKRMVGEYA